MIYFRTPTLLAVIKLALTTIVPARAQLTKVLSESMSYVQLPLLTTKNQVINRCA